MSTSSHENEKPPKYASGLADAELGAVPANPAVGEVKPGVGAPPADQLPTWRRRLLAWERKVGIEAQGTTRVPPDLRDPSAKVWQTAEVWISANTVLPTFGLGILGPAIFGLGLGDSLICIVFFNIIAAAVPAYFAIFGVKTGLRQMIVSRYMWGWWGTKIVAALNLVACVGWSTINSIAGAQVLRAAAGFHLSHAVGVVIIALVTFVMGLVGYRWVHYFDRFAWIPVAIVFVIILGMTAHDFVNTPFATGITEASGVLSFASTIWGYGLGWASLASDYNVYFPVETPSLGIFLWVYAGLLIPLILVMGLGAAVMCAALSIDSWNAQYNAEQLGGLLHAALGKGGFAKFLMVVLVLSVVANNIINVYSFGFSFVAVTPFFTRLPQFIFPVLITAIYIPLAIAGATSFATSLESFMNVLGAWLSIYIAVFLCEHVIFRKASFANYDLTAYNDPRRLPLGLAAVASGCVGAVGAIVGLAQVWWIGPLAKHIGPFGGDVSWLLCLTFTIIVFIPLRYLELKKFGR